MDTGTVELVEKYKPNLDVLRAMKRIELLATVGPSASGKTTLMNRLVDSDPNFAMVVDETTRVARRGETDGVDFAFRRREEVLAEMRNGELVQVALGPNGDFYCTRADSYPEKGISLLALVPAAVREFRRLPIKKFQAAFIVPASYELWQSWLHKQAEAGGWDETKMAGRVAEARQSYEFALADERMEFVLNDDVEKATTRLRQVGLGEAPDDGIKARQTAEENYQKLIDQK